MFKRLAHVCIGSTNLAATEHFYCTILGMKKGFEFLKDGALYGFYIEAGETTFIEVFTQPDGANDDRPIIRHLCLEIEDIDLVIRTIRERGGTVTDKKMGADNSWQCWITDPSGVSIEMMQYTPESTQFTGKPCYVNW
ncbi:MAG: VOC family protein [Chloroflexota bacterium]|nr:VOC family protein [Chloroflexota bacterium]